MAAELHDPKPLALIEAVGGLAGRMSSFGMTGATSFTGKDLTTERKLDCASKGSPRPSNCRVWNHSCDASESRTVS